MYIFYFLHTGVKLGTKQLKKKIKQNNQHRIFHLYKKNYCDVDKN
jgi:hypothetical protein